MTDEVLPDELEGDLGHPEPSDPRVVVRATWQGLIHTCEKVVPAALATHHAVDKAVWDATVEVRRALVQQRYPGIDLVSTSRVGLRNEFELMGAIRSYLVQNPERRFELIPPGRGWSYWSAWFTRAPKPDIDLHPPTGIGSTDQVAMENLLRFTEGKEPISE